MKTLRELVEARLALPAARKEGRFITKDGRVVFIGGPGGGGGGTGNIRTGAPFTSTGDTNANLTTPAITVGVSTRSRDLRGKEALRAPELQYGWTYTEKDTPKSNSYTTQVRSDSALHVLYVQENLAPIYSPRTSEDYIHTRMYNATLFIPRPGTSPSGNEGHYQHLGYFQSPVDAMLALERLIP